jgi:oligopeptidase A
MNLLSNIFFINQMLPQFNLFNVDHIEISIHELINERHTNFVNLENKINDNYNTLSDLELYELAVHEMERIDYNLDYAWSIVSHMKSVKNTDKLREVYDKCIPKIIEESSYTSQSEFLFKAYDKLKLSNKLSNTQKRIIDSSYKGMYLSGISLPENERNEFNDLKLKLNKLSSEFSNNVMDSISKYEMIIDSKNDIDGVPSFALELFSQKAKDKYPESTPEEGPWKITLDTPSYLPFMSHCKNESLRKQLYFTYIQKASSGDHNNIPLIKEIINNKQKMVNMLGFTNYVEFSLEGKMASSKQEIEDLLNNLHSKAKSLATKELEDIIQFKKEKTNSDKLNPWDITYYSEKMKEEKLGYKEEELKPYFPLDGVLIGLFTLAKKLFNIDISEVNVSTDNIHIWDDDVKYFRIYDNGEEIASFYLDPYSRPGEKNGGAWMNGCIDKSNLLDKKPVAYLICNGSPPIKEDNVCIKPSLMSFDDVVTLFHEFGHGLQHMLTTIDESEAAGINNIEWDAVETPSQFMENWCYHKPTLKLFAKHYKSNNPIPDELFEKIIENKNYNSGLGMLRQIYFSMVDLYLYSVNILSEDHVLDIQETFAKRYLITPFVKEDRFLCSFSHIFAGGYSAGYYSYKWAEIMSSDAFGVFEQYDMSDDEKMNEIGMKFRSTILSLGGSKDPSEVFKLFKGSSPSIDALLRHNGIY